MELKLHRGPDAEEFLAALAADPDGRTLFRELVLERALPDLHAAAVAQLPFPEMRERIGPIDRARFRSVALALFAVTMIASEYKRDLIHFQDEVLALDSCRRVLDRCGFRPRDASHREALLRATVRFLYLGFAGRLVESATIVTGGDPVEAVFLVEQVMADAGASDFEDAAELAWARSRLHGLVGRLPGMSEALDARLGVDRKPASSIASRLDRWGAAWEHVISDFGDDMAEPGMRALGGKVARARLEGVHRVRSRSSVDMDRKELRRRELGLVSDEAAEADERAAPPPDPMGLDAAAVLAVARRVLFKHQAEVLELRLAGLSFSEVAERTGRPKSTVQDDFDRALSMTLREYKGLGGAE